MTLLLFAAAAIAPALAFQTSPMTTPPAQTDPSTAAPMPTAPMDPATPAPPMAPDASTAPMASMTPTAGGYQPAQPPRTPTPGATVVFQPSPSVAEAYPAPAPLASYPVCKRGQTDKCRNRGE